MPEDLRFTSTIRVPVRSMESLHRTQEIGPDVSLVKIDVEGFDREVIRGMGDHRYPVVVAEFWDSETEFGKSGAQNKLEDLVNEMTPRNYHWYLVIYRIWGEDRASFYCNYRGSVKKSWGNVFFFQEHGVFAEAQKWCSAVLPHTYFKPVENPVVDCEASPGGSGTAKSAVA